MGANHTWGDSYKTVTEKNKRSTKICFGRFFLLGTDLRLDQRGLLILNEWENFDPSAVTAFCGNSKYSNLLSKTTTCVVSPGITGNLTTMLDYLNAYKACFLAESLGGSSLDDVAIVLKVADTWFTPVCKSQSISKPPT